MDELKRWRCRNDHAMGVVRRNGNGQQLLLYRQALENPSMSSGEVDVIAVVEGYVTDVRCSVCGAIRTWIPGEEALQELLIRMRRQS